MVWKRLTYMTGEAVYVNLANVAWMHRHGEGTQIAFVGGKTEAGLLSIGVRETPQQVLEAPLAS